MKRVPRRFKLLNHTIEVVSIPASKWKHKDWAYWDFDRMRILVCRGKASIARHNFWHEVTHALFDLAGRPDLGTGDEGETLVDNIGGLLAQMMDTAE